jgi:hypothetical protein
LVVRARDQYNSPVYGVDVNIVGPEGTLTGTITSDSLVFEQVLYGQYTGTGLFGGFSVPADTTIGSGNHHLDFLFIIGGVNSLNNNHKLKVSPNPTTPESIISFSNPNHGLVKIDFFDQNGQRMMPTHEQRMPAGSIQIKLKDLMQANWPNHQLGLLRLTTEKQVTTIKLVF